MEWASQQNKTLPTFFAPQGRRRQNLFICFNLFNCFIFNFVFFTTYENKDNCHQHFCRVKKEMLVAVLLSQLRWWIYSPWGERDSTLYLSRGINSRSTRGHKPLNYEFLSLVTIDEKFVCSILRHTNGGPLWQKKINYRLLFTKKTMRKTHTSTLA